MFSAVCQECLLQTSSSSEPAHAGKVSLKIAITVTGQTDANREADPHTVTAGGADRPADTHNISKMIKGRIL